MFNRQLTATIRSAVQSFKLCALLGPRQSGKTTLLRNQFPDFTYASLESPDVLLRAKADPRGFLLGGTNRGLIIDEAQNLPELFSYLQEIVDDPKQDKRFILSGSQNFLLSEKISQSLAGRIAILELLTLTHTEYCTHANVPNLGLFEYLHHGTYPGVYHERLDRNLWYSSYIKTYIERDIRQIINVQDLNQFQIFIKMCAARHGQELNLSQLGADCGLSQSTAQRWLSALQASYLIHLLPPLYRNFSKRLTKTPKLYFYDSGLVCYLLGIENPEHLSIHANRGAIFEGYVITELIKHSKTTAQAPGFYHWRDKSKMEIDLVIEKGSSLTGIEIKSSKTALPEFADSLLRWQRFTQAGVNVVYAGDKNLTIRGVSYVAWDRVEDVLRTP